MTNIFYISSIGGSATGWLSKTLGIHSKISSWHGTRSIPPKDSGINDISPEDFAEGLKTCVESSQGSKIYGAVHGFYGVTAKVPIESRGGKFSYIIRNPITRISSLFSMNFLKSQDGSGLTFNNSEEIYGYINNIIPQVRISKTSILEYSLENAQPQRLSSKWLKSVGPNQINKIKKALHTKILGHQDIYGGFVTDDSGKPVSEEALKCLQLFSGLCVAILHNDLECFSNTALDQAIVMEQMVRSRSYFKSQVWKNIPEMAQCDEAYLDEVFKEKSVNEHSLSKLEFDEIYALWPKSFKDIYDHISDVIGTSKLEKMYTRFEYRLP
jgi:hypothetical protein